MDHFTFNNTARIIFGKGSVWQIGRVIKEAGVRRVLLVAGGGFMKITGSLTPFSRMRKPRNFLQIPLLTPCRARL
jgi:alcohol dehydrogenase YqhD (iron-dependent ADH family)